MAQRGPVIQVRVFVLPFVGGSQTFRTGRPHTCLCLLTSPLGFVLGSAPTVGILWYTRPRFRNMSSPNDTIVRDIVRRIVNTAQPEKVILFGSQARGDARPDSDFDVLVIKQSDEPRYRRSIPLYIALADLPVEVEVMVYTPEEVDEWSQVPQAFVTTAVREGTTIYERRG